MEVCGDCKDFRFCQNLQQRRSVGIAKTVDFARTIAIEDAKSVNVAKTTEITKYIQIAKSVQFIVTEDNPLCCNSEYKTVYDARTQQYYIIIGISL
jgi:uncharacterized protein (UPF0179 family)